MTNEEILNRFDVLYNNITSSQAPGLDGYEKSVFWNKAQLEVLKNHLNPKGNKYGEGFDGSSKRQVEFAPLIKVITVKQASGNSDTDTGNTLADNVVTFKDGDGILSILNESVKVDGKTVVVVPINHVEYDTLMSRPYKYPPKSQAWRLIEGKDSYRIISSDIVTEYEIRYVKLPADVDLTGNTDPEVPGILHDEILQRAVELAKAAYVGDANQQQIIQSLGERSE